MRPQIHFYELIILSKSNETSESGKKHFRVFVSPSILLGLAYEQERELFLIMTTDSFNIYAKTNELVLHFMNAICPKLQKKKKDVKMS